MATRAILVSVLFALSGCSQQASDEFDSLTDASSALTEPCTKSVLAAAERGEESSARVLEGEHYTADGGCYVRFQEEGDTMEYECGALFTTFAPADSSLADSIAKAIGGTLEKYYPLRCWGTGYVTVPTGTELQKLVAAYAIPAVFRVEPNYQGAAELP